MTIIRANRGGLMMVNKKDESFIVWHQLVHQAQKDADYAFDENVEHYIIKTINDFMKNIELCSNNTLLYDFLYHSNQQFAYDIDAIRRIGDKCLILSSFFESATHNNSSHLIDVGKSSYQLVANTNVLTIYEPTVFKHLDNEFIEVVNTLKLIKSTDNA
jgi:hypothetical protein